MKWVSKRELKNKNEELNEEIRRVSGLANRFLTEKSKKEKLIETINEENINLKSQLEKITIDFKASDTLVNALIIDIENLKKKLDDTEKSRRKNAGKIGGMNKKMNVLTKQLEESRELIKELNRLNRIYKNKKDAKEYGKLKNERN